MPSLLYCCDHDIEPVRVENMPSEWASSHLYFCLFKLLGLSMVHSCMPECTIRVNGTRGSQRIVGQSLVAVVGGRIKRTYGFVLRPGTTAPCCFLAVAIWMQSHACECSHCRCSHASMPPEAVSERVADSSRRRSWASGTRCIVSLTTSCRAILFPMSCEHICPANTIGSTSCSDNNRCLVFVMLFLTTSCGMNFSHCAAAQRRQRSLQVEVSTCRKLFHSCPRPRKSPLAEASACPAMCFREAAFAHDIFRKFRSFL